MRFLGFLFLILLPLACGAAGPHSIQELFKPALYRWYSLSPNGRYLVEAAMTDKGDADRVERVRSPEDLAKLRLPEQRILLTDLQTMKYAEIGAQHAGR
ncbi:MAG: hypothetical protein ACREVJ_08980, partial [Gammaproteobacteria bacterium]